MNIIALIAVYSGLAREAKALLRKQEGYGLVLAPYYNRAPQPEGKRN